MCKLILSRTLRLHHLKPSYGIFDLLRRQAVDVEVRLIPKPINVWRCEQLRCCARIDHR